jgi:hypothetical protein
MSEEEPAGRLLSPDHLHIARFSTAHASASRYFRESGSVTILHHSGGGSAEPDYKLKFVDFNTFLADVNLQSGCLHFEVHVVKIVGGSVQFGFCSAGFEPRELSRGEICESMARGRGR